MFLLVACSVAILPTLSLTLPRFKHDNDSPQKFVNIEEKRNEQ